VRFPPEIPVFGDQSYRGECDSETTDQINFFSWLAFNYPEHKEIAIHPKNEGFRSWGTADIDKKMGSLNTGASDVIIPCGFVMEIKRADHTKSSWKKGQREYLLAAKKMGCFVCVGLGFEGAKLGFLEWVKTTKTKSAFDEWREGLEW
jgi:hypothetical protein